MVDQGLILNYIIFMLSNSAEVLPDGYRRSVFNKSNMIKVKPRSSFAESIKRVSYLLEQ